jgi:hypothetical protein
MAPAIVSVISSTSFQGRGAGNYPARGPPPKKARASWLS